MSQRILVRFVKKNRQILPGQDFVRTPGGYDAPVVKHEDPVSLPGLLEQVGDVDDSRALGRQPTKD